MGTRIKEWMRVGKKKIVLWRRRLRQRRQGIGVNVEREEARKTQLLISRA